MGQHKHNPNCQLAREGKLPPKPKKMSKREQERQLYAMCQAAIFGRVGNGSLNHTNRKTTEGNAYK